VIPFAAVLFAQVAGTLEISNTSRIDARSNQPFTIAPNPPPREAVIAADAQLAPLARLRLTDRRWDFTLTYSPTFTVTDIELSPYAQPVVLNAGATSIGWHNRRVRVIVSEAASYGLENLAYLYGNPIAGQPITAGQSQAMGQMTTQGAGQTTTQSLGQTGASAAVPISAFPFGSSNSNVFVQVQATRRLSFNVSGGYTISGNLAPSEQASAIYPEQFGPTASASALYSSSLSDTFVTTANAQEITTPAALCTFGAVGQLCREVTPTLALTETYRHRVTPTATVSASLGVAASVYEVATGTSWGILPVGGVSYADRFSAPPKDPRDQLDASGIRLSADLAPMVNVFTGSPSNRIQLNGSLFEHVAPGVVVNFVAGVLQTVPIPERDPSPLTVINGGVEVRMRVTRQITASAGLQGFWQRQENVGLLPTTNTISTTGPTTSASEVGYISVTVRLPRLRL